MGRNRRSSSTLRESGSRPRVEASRDGKPGSPAADDVDVAIRYGREEARKRCFPSRPDHHEGRLPSGPAPFTTDANANCVCRSEQDPTRILVIPTRPALPSARREVRTTPDGAYPESHPTRSDEIHEGKRRGRQGLHEYEGECTYSGDPRLSARAGVYEARHQIRHSILHTV